MDSQGRSYSSLTPPVCLWHMRNRANWSAGHKKSRYNYLLSARVLHRVVLYLFFGSPLLIPSTPLSSGCNHSKLYSMGALMRVCPHAWLCASIDTHSASKPRSHSILIWVWLIAVGAYVSCEIRKSAQWWFSQDSAGLARGARCLGAGVEQVAGHFFTLI